MSGFNNNGINPNQMGFGQNNFQANPSLGSSANIQQIAQALGVNPSQLTPANLAMLQRQAQARQQQQQQTLRQQQSARQGSPNPQLIQQYMAQAQQQNQPIQQQRNMATLQSQLPPALQNALQNARGDTRQQAVLAQIAQAQAQNRKMPVQQQFNNQPIVPPVQQLTSFNPNVLHQGSSPLMGPLPLTPQPLVGNASPQAYHPSLLSTPPQATSNATRIPSPPRAEGRRTSLTNQNTAPNAIQLNQVSVPRQQPAPQAPAHNPSTATNTEANPGLASVIPSVPPSTFKLDDSKLRLNKTVDRASISAPSSGTSSDAPSPAKPPEAEVENAPAEASKPPNAMPAAQASAPKPPVRFVPPQPSAAPARPSIPTALFRDGRHVDFAGDRKKGAEGMRGSMRNEVARLMYAAGDELEPDAGSVDYLEDLVVEFMSDLCRPIPPMRQAPGQPYQPIPLTTTIVRDRLATRPALKKYLDRFDTMSYLSGEINKSRRTFQNAESAEAFTDLVDTVGRGYLEIDATGPSQTKEKRKGRPRKNVDEGVKREEGDPDTPKKKPGPKKGWKQSLAAQGVDVSSKGKRVGGGVKKRRLDAAGGIVKREQSMGREGSVGSPMV